MNNNHLNGFGEINKPALQKTIVAKYSDFQNITENLFKYIDFSDKTYINRLDDESVITNDENFLGLMESIKQIGLLNPIYLFQKTKNEYIIISGWRRLLALKEIYKSNKNMIFSQKAIIFNKNTPNEVLENTSIHENTKRKDLSILELSYKFNNLAKIDGIGVDDCLKKFNIGKTQFHAIKKAINFDPFIKDFVLETVGPLKSDYLNKILEKLLLENSETSAHIVIKNSMNKTVEELKTTLKNLEENSEKSREFFEYKFTKNGATFKIKETISEENCKKIENYIKRLLKK
ncbi:ParB/RepB/Spo0J family partition protein [Cetobacterium sp.]|uniref:ParB/RepB/Spo0J family partition protein n=1 Tax=Cetobacterium sp. TaxID=2071632 RepID=UPI003F2C473A